MFTYLVIINNVITQTQTKKSVHFLGYRVEHAFQLLFIQRQLYLLLTIENRKLTINKFFSSKVSVVYTLLVSGFNVCYKYFSCHLNSKKSANFYKMGKILAFFAEERRKKIEKGKRNAFFFFIHLNLYIESHNVKKCAFFV